MEKLVVLKVSGMHCSNCEERIRRAVMKLDVEQLIVSYSLSKVQCRTNDVAKLVKTIEKLGYEAVLIEDVSNSAKLPYKGVIVALTTMLGLYLIINNTVGFNFIPEIDENVTYPILFVVGLLTSLHCLSMCGGIVLSQSIAFIEKGNKGKPLKTLKPALQYNVGRVIAYTLVGGIVGGIGSIISFSSQLKSTITIFAGVFMILLGLSMLEPFAFLRNYVKLPKLFKMPSFKGNKNTPFYVGLFTGLMPCGPLQTMQIYALGTGSIGRGALSMFIFSLGTVPLMLGLGSISAYIGSNLNRKLLKTSAVLVMVLGLVIIDRGLTLQGRSLKNQIFPTNRQQLLIGVEMMPVIMDELQIIETYANNSGYQPSFYILQKGKKVKWIINGETINGCNNEIIIPQLEIRQKLESGINIVEFVPEEEGELVFSCWMGMLGGSFHVVENVENLPNNLTIPENKRTPACCQT